MYKFLIFFLVSNIVIAQTKTNARINYDGKEGLHKIVIPSEIRSFSNEDLSDFRILDSNKNEVPYFSFRNENQSITSDFKEYSIISKTEILRKASTLIVENPEPKLNSISLFIANYNDAKNYSISGSNDQKKWFGLTNSGILDDLNSPDLPSVVKSIAFPLMTYKYLKFDFNDSISLPINVLKVGNFSNKSNKNQMLSVAYNQKLITELKADKKTRIHIVFNNFQFLDQIKFTIANPKMYKRSVRIFKKVNRKVKHKFKMVDEEITNFDLNSETQNTFDLNSIHEKELIIEIENLDNPPLTIANIQFFQTPIIVIADFQANQNYTISTGDKTLFAPQYDIENFKNSISTNLPEAKIEDINISKEATNKSEIKPFWQQNWFMWLCISLGGIAIFYFAISLMKDMNQKQ